MQLKTSLLGNSNGIGGVAEDLGCQVNLLTFIFSLFSFRRAWG